MKKIHGAYLSARPGDREIPSINATGFARADAGTRPKVGTFFKTQLWRPSNRTCQAEVSVNQPRLASKPCHPDKIFHNRIRVFCQTQSRLSIDRAHPPEVSVNRTRLAPPKSRPASSSGSPFDSLRSLRTSSKNLKEYRKTSKNSDKDRRRATNHRRNSKETEENRRKNTRQPLQQPLNKGFRWFRV